MNYSSKSYFLDIYRIIYILEHLQQTILIFLNRNSSKSFSKVYQQKIYLLSAMAENPYLFSNHSNSICCNELLKQNLWSLAIGSNLSLNNLQKTKLVFFNSDSRKVFSNCFISNNIFLAIIAVNSHFFSSYSDNICCNEL